MASSLPTEKLNKNNYASWSYKMHQYLLGHGYWSYVEGANEVAPELTHKDFMAWEQGASRVLYRLASCVHDQMLVYIKDVEALKEAWENLKKIFVASTTAWKLQLREELYNFGTYITFWVHTQRKVVAQGYLLSTLSTFLI